MRKLTVLEKRITAVLDDGERHKRSELLDCLNENSSNKNNLAQVLFSLRKKLKTVGQSIVCELYMGTIYYRHVILFSKTKE